MISNSENSRSFRYNFKKNLNIFFSVAFSDKKKDWMLFLFFFLAHLLILLLQENKKSNFKACFFLVCLFLFCFFFKNYPQK